MIDHSDSPRADMCPDGRSHGHERDCGVHVVRQLLGEGATLLLGIDVVDEQTTHAALGRRIALHRRDDLGQRALDRADLGEDVGDAVDDGEDGPDLQQRAEKGRRAADAPAAPQVLERLGYEEEARALDALPGGAYDGVHIAARGRGLGRGERRETELHAVRARVHERDARVRMALEHHPARQLGRGERPAHLGGYEDAHDVVTLGNAGLEDLHEVAHRRLRRGRERLRRGKRRVERGVVRRRIRELGALEMHMQRHHGDVMTLPLRGRQVRRAVGDDFDAHATPLAALVRLLADAVQA